MDKFVIRRGRVRTKAPTRGCTKMAESTREPTKTAESTRDPTKTAESTCEPTKTAESTCEPTKTAESTRDPTKMPESTSESITMAESIPEYAKTTESGLGMPATLDPTLIANRCYLKCMGTVIRFLVVDFKLSGGKRVAFSKSTFDVWYQFALKQDNTLTDIRDLFPPDAHYPSEDFQMVVMRTLAHMVRSYIRQKYEESDSKSYCIKGGITGNDGSSETLSVLVRFMSDGKPEEHLIGLLRLERNDADYIADRILHHLTEYNFSPQYIVCQCYEGPSLTSSCKRGVQAALQRKLNRSIPTIHGDHRPVCLPLALAHAVEADPSVRKFFRTGTEVKRFLQLRSLSQRSDRPALTSLLETQPMTQYQLTKLLVEHFDSICDLLSDISKDVSVPKELCNRASRLLSAIQETFFFSTGKFVWDILETAEPEAADALFRRCTVCEKYLPFSAEVTLYVTRSLETMSADPLYFALRYTDSEPDIEAKRTSFIFEQPATLCGILDLAITEMEKLWSPGNRAIIKAIFALFPTEETFLDIDACLPLLDIARVSRTSLEAERDEAKTLLSRKLLPRVDLVTLCEIFRPHAATFPALYELYGTAVLMGIPADACKNSFPPLKSSMLNEREMQLAFLSHELATLNSLCMDEFASEFLQNNQRFLA